VLTLIWVLAGGQRVVLAQELEDPRPGGHATPRGVGGCIKFSLSLCLLTSNMKEIFSWHCVDYFEWLRIFGYSSSFSSRIFSLVLYD
jgi:hypothetical protein